MASFIFKIILGASLAALAGDLLTIKNGFSAHKQEQNPSPLLGHANDSSTEGDLKISAISEKEAQSLLNEYIRNKDLGLDYPIDGNFEKAYMMAKIAEKKNIIVGKVFAEGNLVVHTEIGEFEKALWDKHTAPLVYVKKDNGDLELMVLDPTLSKKPVSVADWKGKLVDPNSFPKSEVNSLYFGSRFQLYSNKIEESRSSWNSKDEVIAKKKIDEINGFIKYMHRESSSPASPSTSSEGIK